MEMPKVPANYVRDLEVGARGRAGGKAGGAEQMEASEEPDWWVAQTGADSGAHEDGIAHERGGRSEDVDVDLELERGDVMGYDRNRGAAM